METYFQQTPQPEENSPLILAVDDQEANLDLLEAILVTAGHRVITALDAFKAIQLMEIHPIDLAILDVMMPKMTGFDLCKRLKGMSKKKFFPVILITALDQHGNKIIGLEAGADDFFSKPFNKIELITKIGSLIKLKKLQDELDHSEDIILTLAIAIDAKDPYTKGHSERVGNLSARFVEFIGLSDKEILNIKKAGILHDIGKIGLREDILHKSGPLHKEELDQIRRHPVIGEDICKSLSSLKMILPAIRHHHERWDGNGFPDGLCGEEIPFAARAVGIVDTFDAMVTNRPYRNSLARDEALKIMKDEAFSGQWDPYLIDKFVKMMEGVTA